MTATKNRVAIIPARGGSKRLPGKNIKPFFGHPMLAYAISAAFNSGLFTKVVVSTDDPQIGEVAKWYGADYLPRPAKFATDNAGLPEVSLHLLETYKKQSFQFDALCQLMPNCPLRRSDDIVALNQQFETNKRHFQISVIPYRGVYPHWALLTDETGQGQWLFGDYLVPSQQLETVSCPTGAIWWVTVPEFLEQQAFYGTPFHLALMDGNRGMDIDDAEELEL
ncbi:MAG: acylneuraminate cytidylyltransferase family protein, partial [Chloroflexota bacterium]